MNIALVCIAKDEDNYINEWVGYHLKLGFNKIYIYENDWYSNINHPDVITILVNGSRQQIPVYNHFINEYKNEYDWVAFLDVDEFIVLKKHNTIHELMNDYNTESALGINWVFFGDNNKTFNGDYSVLERFTKRQEVVNGHIKSIVNPKKVIMMNVHSHVGQCIDTNRKRIDNSSFNPNGPIDVAQINHYFTKTKDEYIKKMNRGRADTGTYRDISDFDKHNINEIEDLIALNFYKNDNNNILNPQG
jgi:hypothetical protein